jgi:hypothetical protein
MRQTLGQPPLERATDTGSVKSHGGETMLRLEQETPMTTYSGYCVKCREKREFEGEKVDLSNGRFAAQGACPTCGTAMVRMLGTDN